MLANCVFSANSASQYGGGMFIWSADAILANCTFSGNFAPQGRAVACDCPWTRSNFEATNCILRDGGDEIWNNDGSTITVTYSDVQGGWPGDGNLDADPYFLDSDQDNFRLGPGSPCIDTGNNAAVPPDVADLDDDGDPNEPIPYDLDGNPRVVDGNADMIAVVDMGAYERGPIMHVDDDATVRGDGLSWISAFQDLQDALAAAANDPSIGEIRVAGGTYVPSNQTDPNDARTATFQLLSGLALYGGYAGLADPNNPDFRDIDLYESILSGDLFGNDDPNLPLDANDPLRTDNSVHVVTGSGTNQSAVLDGFTVTAGNAKGAGPYHMRGGGMYNHTGSPTVTNCIFAYNTSVSAMIGGGGMCNQMDSEPNLTGCTFSGNSAYQGAGMANSHANPILTHCTFIGNHATSGGGMFNSRSCPTMSDCIFNNNTGGGMFNNEYSDPTLTDCTFTGNTNLNGGGLANLSVSSPILIDCTFTGNSATLYGGGVHNFTISSPTMINCAFRENSAGTGGAVYSSFSSNPTLAYCTLIGNTAIDGAGIYSSSSNPTVTTCLFTGNRATRGGGMYNEADCSPTITNCTFADNVATEEGGGIYNHPGGKDGHNDHILSESPAQNDSIGGMQFHFLLNDPANSTITSCILWGNTAPLGSQIFCGCSNVTYSCVQGGWPGEGNIEDDPNFVDPDGSDDDPNTWADNDYHLSQFSPCIDTGDPDELGTTEFDIDGEARVMRGRVDMGADEFTGIAYVCGDLNCDGIRDEYDVDVFVLALVNPAGYATAYPDCNILNADCNGDGNINALDIDPFVSALNE